MMCSTVIDDKALGNGGLCTDAQDLQNRVLFSRIAASLRHLGE